MCYSYEKQTPVECFVHKKFFLKVRANPKELSRLSRPC